MKKKLLSSFFQHKESLYFTLSYSLDGFVFVVLLKIHM